MSIQDLFDKIEERVSDELIDHLFPKMIERHCNASQRKDNRSCECTFCKTKKEATLFIGTLTNPLGFDQCSQAYPGMESDLKELSLANTLYDDWERRKLRKKIHRAQIRQFFREEMSSVKEE